MDQKNFKINLSLDENKFIKKNKDELNNNTKKEKKNMVNNILNNIDERNIDKVFGASLLAHIVIDHINNS
tara:strand:- start:158 stop:367 length:210 start_codon:yes stop_codon:yes gene_type:complete